MSDEVLIIGDLRFAAKTSKLLGYTLNNNLYSPKEVDFTRGSTATFLNNSNVLTTSAANIVRVQSSNLLNEEERTNTILQSEDLTNATNWYCTATITANNTNAPTGLATADKVTFTGSGQFCSQSTAVLLNNKPYWFSCFVKNSTFAAGETFVLRVNRYAGVNAVLTVNIAAGTVTPSFSASTGNIYVTNSLKSSIENYGNGWYRIGIGFTTGSAGAATGVGTQLLYGNAAKALFAWGFQFEQGGKLTSYIPTTTTTITRSADLTTIPNLQTLIGKNFTFYAALNLGNANAEQYFLEFFNDVEGRSFLFHKRYNYTSYLDSNLVFTIWQTNGIVGAIASSFNITDNNIKIAFTYNGVITKCYLNGTFIGSSTLAPRQNYNKFKLISKYDDSVGYGLFSSIKCFNSILSEEDCIALTATFSTEALAWKSRVESNGGTVPTYILGLFDNFFFKPAVSAGNILNKLDRLNIYSGLSSYEIAARTNLINGNHYVTPINSTIFDINGYKSNGVDSYLDLNFYGTGSQFTQDSNIGGVVMKNPNFSYTREIMGAYDGTRNYSIEIGSSNNVYVSNNGEYNFYESTNVIDVDDYVFIATKRNSSTSFNILINSSHNFFVNPNNLTLTPWVNTGFTHTITHFTDGGINDGPYDRVTADNPESGYYYQEFYVNPAVPNGTYSVYLKGTGDVRLGIYNNGETEITYVTLTDTWTKYSVNKSNLTSAYLNPAIYFDSMSTTVDIANSSFESTPDPVTITDTSEGTTNINQYELTINNSLFTYDTNYHACSFHGSADLNYNAFREIVTNLLNALPDEAYRP
jgi:hypothetical protein